MPIPAGALFPLFKEHRRSRFELLDARKGGSPCKVDQNVKTWSMAGGSIRGVIEEPANMAFISDAK